MTFHRTRSFNITEDIDTAIREYAEDNDRTISDSIRIILGESLAEMGYIE